MNQNMDFISLLTWKHDLELKKKDKQKGSAGEEKSKPK